MAQSGNEAASKSDVTSLDTKQDLDFDNDTLKAIVEVYKNEGNEAYLKEDYVNAVYFYTEGIKVNCKDQDLKGKLYSKRAYAYLRLGNYIYSLTDAKNAMDRRPLSIKPIIAGAKASVKLSLFELAITFCYKGLAIDLKNTAIIELLEMALPFVDEATSINKVFVLSPY
ncbi:tetratricopeptide repeat protein 4-like [Porites lutea]|uniref:tetratricopeptide repeat protein 4-like n=1 Tax=Porites lutea TaxID=51062 RepID=UPI003CC5A3E6